MSAKKSWGASESASFAPELSGVIDEAIRRKIVPTRSDALREGIRLFAAKHGIPLKEPAQ
jgi:Arc/MetJ-type ribon-helix-helix transcriptional regulator